MKFENKLDHELDHDAISLWLNTSKSYRINKRERYLEYVRQLRSTHKANNLLIYNFFMSYTNIINFISKNAVVATVVVILALSGVSAVAAEIFAPVQYKPSTITGLRKFNSFEECQQAGGKITEKNTLQSCEISGQTFMKLADPSAPNQDSANISLRQCNFLNEDSRGFSLLVPDEYNCQIVYPEYEGNSAYLKITNGKLLLQLDYVPRLGCADGITKSPTGTESCGDYVLFENDIYKVFGTDYVATAVAGGKKSDKNYPAINIYLTDADGKPIQQGDAKISNLSNQENETLKAIIDSIKPQAAETSPAPNNDKLLTFAKSNFEFQYSNTYNLDDTDDSNNPSKSENISLINNQDNEKVVNLIITDGDPLFMMNSMIGVGVDPKISLDTQISNQYGITGRKIKHQLNYADAGWIPEFTTTQIIFKKDNLYYNISTKVGKLCWNPDNTCEFNKADEDQLDLIFNTFRFSDSKQSYTNPFYPELAINYDSSWKFTTSTRETEIPQVLARTVTLEKNGAKLTFDFKPVEVVHNSCITQLKYTEQVKLRADFQTLNRYSVQDENRYFYAPGDMPPSCYSYLIKMVNMEKYQTNPNASFEGELNINLTPKNADTQTIIEADQIILNSIFIRNIY